MDFQDSEKEIAIKNILLYIGTMFGGQFILSLLFLNLYGDSLKTQANLFLFSYLITFLALFIYNYNFLKEEFKKFIKKFKTNFLYIIIAFFSLLFILYILGLIFDFFGYESNPENQKEIENMYKYYKIHVIIASVFLAPLVEEIVYRKSVFGLINHKIKIFLSGFIFGLIHIISDPNLYTNFSYEIWNLIPYIVPGIVLAYTYYKSDNLLNTILIHMIYNVLAIISI